MRYPLILEHLTSNDLPAEWVKRLPAEHIFSVLIVTEKPAPQHLNAEQARAGTPLFGILREKLSSCRVD
jgi:hypothetical protein